MYPAGVSRDAVDLPGHDVVPAGRDVVPSEVPDDDQGHGNDDDDHQDGLEEVGPAEGLVPSEERVKDDDGTADDDTDLHPAVLQEHLHDDAAALEPGADVDGEEEQDDDRAGDPQVTLVVCEAVGEELGHGEGVLGYEGVFPEPLRDEEPGCVGSYQEPDTDPRLAETGQDDGSRETHQEPSAHVGGLCGHCANVGPERPSTEDVILHAVPVLDPPEVDTDDDQGDEIDREGQYGH